jgi:hypothetical protein
MHGSDRQEDYDRNNRNAAEHSDTTTWWQSQAAIRHRSVDRFAESASFYRIV